MLLNDEIKKAVSKTLKKEARQEALEILSKTTDDRRNEFLKYYNEDKGNICCLVLDSIKNELIESGEMTMKDNDFFGGLDYF